MSFRAKFLLTSIILQMWTLGYDVQASQLFLQRPNEESRQLDWLEKGSEPPPASMLTCPLKKVYWKKYFPINNDLLYLCIVPPSGFSQSGAGGMLGSSLPPFQTSMSSAAGQTGTGPALDSQKLLGVDNKGPGSTSGSSTVRSSDVVSSGGPGTHSQDHPAGIRSCGCVLPHCSTTISPLSV